MPAKCLCAFVKHDAQPVNATRFEDMDIREVDEETFGVSKNSSQHLQASMDKWRQEVDFYLLVFRARKRAA